ncbi:hypothetical protein L3049_15205 [Labilibaculum sp. DW002]|jgi:hypothetical protein|uniref:YARHG domain-containing protein n=1 Tax=Paralabilibaculum antarcticum TaxID=2912572 RepID=A0ABT5VVA5_9BACT|nr:hypothetical protein [Labilibaculum sp. DW002]MDE5419346.1 hypothetical protein [Labilibaculum sp. DW002]
MIKHFQFIFLLLLFLPQIGNAELCLKNQDLTDSIYKAPNLFESDDLLELSITTDLKSLLRDIGKKNTYHKGRLSYFVGDTIVSMIVELKTRGNFRKDRSICAFPPLKIKFNQAESSYTIFHDQKKLKMVTHCQNRNPRFEQMLIQEYLIYKAYNIFTPESFKVRLAKITYKDSKNSVKPVTKLTFFIEDFEKMAERNGKIPRYDKKIHQDHTLINKITKLAVFQYMIGNTDWGVPTLHNIKLISKTPKSRTSCVPYDFDWASLVNAPYAIPNEKLNIESIHERLYRGYKRSAKDLEYIFREFRMKKENLYKLYQNCSYLSEKELERSLNYFDEFYELIDDPKQINREFIDKARTLKLK